MYKFEQKTSNNIGICLGNDLINGRTIQISPDTVDDDNLNFPDAYFDNLDLNNRTYYYIKFAVTPLQTDQNIRLQISAGNENSLDTYAEQFIQSYRVPNQYATNSSKLYFETIIAPNANYSTIWWKLQRTSEDYREESGEHRSASISDVEIRPVVNKIINKKIRKLGVQGPPSMLMCINGEPIRIGKNGIYELNNPNINIDFLSFIPKLNDFFIIDYQYEEGEE